MIIVLAVGDHIGDIHEAYWTVMIADLLLSINFFSYDIFCWLVIFFVGRWWWLFIAAIDTKDDGGEKYDSTGYSDSIGQYRSARSAGSACWYTGKAALIILVLISTYFISFLASCAIKIAGAFDAKICIACFAIIEILNVRFLKWGTIFPVPIS